jgi:DNA-binding MarR family transcriptional regulator
LVQGFLVVSSTGKSFAVKGAIISNACERNANEHRSTTEIFLAKWEIWWLRRGSVGRLAVMSEPPPRSTTPDELTTVVLSEQDLRDAARILATLINFGGSSQALKADNLRSEPTRRMMVKRARTTFLNRRRRGQIFGAKLFGEPAWDMLLSLYITEAIGPRNSVGRLIAFSGVSMTTALRWLDVLEKDDLIERTEHPTDRRSAIISLSDRGRTVLDAYFSETVTEGL